MKSGMIRGVVAGSLLGVAAVAAASMMNKQTQRKVSRMAASGGKKIAEKANELFGR